MKRQIVVRPLAREDLIGQATYIAEVSPESAWRLFEADERTFVELAEMPQLGKETGIEHPHLRGARLWTIPGFPHHRILYLHSNSILEIVRIVHTSQDFDSIVGNEKNSRKE